MVSTSYALGTNHDLSAGRSLVAVRERGPESRSGTGPTILVSPRATDVCSGVRCPDPCFGYPLRGGVAFRAGRVSRVLRTLLPSRCHSDLGPRVPPTILDRFGQRLLKGPSKRIQKCSSTYQSVPDGRRGGRRREIRGGILSRWCSEGGLFPRRVSGERSGSLDRRPLRRREEHQRPFGRRREIWSQG